MGIAAPVLQGDGNAIASLTVTLPIVRFHATDTQRFTSLVVDAAAELSKALGHTASA